MCLHIALTENMPELAKRYDKKADYVEGVNKMYHISAHTHPQYPVITSDGEIQLFKWGFIPYWISDSREAETISEITLNARAETIFHTPTFREAARSKRCLIPVSGFFDWRREGDREIPYFISLKNTNIFSLAGIFDKWHNPDTDENVYTFSVVTCYANPMMSYIHNTNFRMPVILPSGKEHQWLDTHLSERAAEMLMRPFDDKQMCAYVVSNDFIEKPFDDPSILTRSIS